MQTKKLCKLSLIIALIGIVILFILNENSEPNITKINEINEKKLDQWVKIQGSLEYSREIKTKTGVMNIFTIQDNTSSIEIVYYDKINLTKNLEVIGKIAEYQGKMQIIASTIKCLS
jgi:RecJ-like exonuclease